LPGFFYTIKIMVIENPTNKRERVFNKFDGTCAYCGVELEWDHNPFKDSEDRYTEYQMDHIIPKSKGGHSTGDDNFAPSCYRCNAKKGPRTPREFLHKCLKRRKKIIGELNRLDKQIENLNKNFGSHINGQA